MGRRAPRPRVTPVSNSTRSTLDSLQWHSSHTLLPDALYTPLNPDPVVEPELIAVSPEVATLLGLDGITRNDETLRDVVAGALVPAGSDPCALAYAGHQFGSYVAQLGDGRACLLGDVEGADGCSWDMQLKGSGPTPYSRGFDGRAVLRSTIREYLAGEAMAGLAIPSTRALAIVHSPLPVFREDVETAAVLLRVARTHLRFGTFQYLAAREDRDALAALADFTIARLMPDVAEGDYEGMLRFATQRTAELLAAWQSEGFAHGVMNTDNMSIIGDTIDYGPYAFLDHFDPAFSPNTTDVGGRYAFGRQPTVALWNLARLADALSAILDRERGQAVIDGYAEAFNTALTDRMRAKLGLDVGDDSEATRATDEELVTSLLDALSTTRANYATFFRRLSELEIGDRESLDRVCAVAQDEGPLRNWLPRYVDRLELRTQAECRSRMQAKNPLYVLKNWIAQHVIERATAGDYEPIDQFRAALADPYTQHEGLEGFSVLDPQPVTNMRLGCSS